MLYVLAVKPGGVAPRLDVWQKYVKMYIKIKFFDIMSKFQKDLVDFSAGIGIF
jgi:hypothetical protein